jgi:hypothetical protein
VQSGRMHTGHNEGTPSRRNKNDVKGVRAVDRLLDGAAEANERGLN